MAPEHDEHATAAKKHHVNGNIDYDLQRPFGECTTSAAVAAVETITTTTTMISIKKHVRHAVDPVVSAAAVTKRYYTGSGSTGHPLAAPTGLPLSFRGRALS